MARIARAVLPDVPHHVTQRGNFGQAIFESDDDRRQYLEWLAFYAGHCGAAVWAYCLMSNHVHFVVVPRKPDSLARTFNQTHMRYAQMLNRRHGQAGHLWQGRFYSCALDERHVYRAVRYVELNPVRAGVVKAAWKYPWSSAPAHVLGTDDPLLDDSNWFRRSMADWKAYLAEAESKDWQTALRVATRTGRPLGGRGFVERMEAALGRTLRPRNPGRPAKP